MYLLDTNICIYLIKKQPIQVVKRIKSIKPYQILLSAITLAELEYGAFKSSQTQKNRTNLLNFVSGFQILAFDDRDAEYYGYLRAHLEKLGKMIGPYDLQIAAQALQRNITLVSNNTKEFQRVPGIKLENWV